MSRNFTDTSRFDEDQKSKNFWRIAKLMFQITVTGIVLLTLAFSVGR